MSITRVAKLTTPEEFANHLQQIGAEIPFESRLESGPDSVLARPLKRDAFSFGNRFAILPMEGWDGTLDGRPTDLVRRRWQRFGESGAKLIWGGEAVAVRQDGRANPNQLMLTESTVDDIAELRSLLVVSHQRAFGTVDDLSVGIQLTHSGRFAKPEDRHRWQARTVYPHPWLDRKFQTDTQQALLSDDELYQLIEQFVSAAGLAQQAGFEWVDLKHCHGYLGHELLSAFDRPGDFGGSLSNRSRFLREIIQGIRRRVPGLKIGVRLSLFDFVPFTKGGDGIGQPEVDDDYPYSFGGDGTGRGIDLAEPIALIGELQRLGVNLICTTAGCPYYVPHIVRPAIFPPSDGYLPPEDPLLGVARQIQATAALKKACPETIVVGSGYSYLQQWLPHVAQAVVRSGGADLIGIGRMVLSYPQMPADVLAGNGMQRKQICRTFSDCTTAPRNGLVSGCYPLDPFYKARPEAETLKRLKQSDGSPSA